MNVKWVQVAWFKDDVPLFNATKFLDSSGVDPNSVLLQHKIEIDREKGAVDFWIDILFIY